MIFPLVGKAVLYLLIGSAIWPVDTHTWPIQKMFKFPMVGPQIIPPAQAGNFPEFPSEGQLWGKFDSSSVCMRMRGEQSSGMHVKLGDGGDLIMTNVWLILHFSWGKGKCRLERFPLKMSSWSESYILIQRAVQIVQVTRRSVWEGLEGGRGRSTIWGN